MVDVQACLAVGSLVLAWLLGLSLARQNLKMLAKTRPERVAARRREKRIKNIKLAMFYGIDYRPPPLEEISSKEDKSSQN
jgi:hypothetical protein